LSFINNKPLVSVIIPCYNHGKYLNFAIDSVLAQTYSNFEIILVDDGSDDPETIILIDSYLNPRIKIIRTKNQGVSAARNCGIFQSNGQYILPLDSDNILHPKYIEMTIPFLKDYDVIYTNLEYFGARNEKMLILDFTIETQLTFNIVDNTALFKKKFWQKVGGYDETLKIGWEDWDFWLKLVSTGAKFYHLKEDLFMYRYLENSRNRSFDLNKQSILEFQIIENNINLYKKTFPNPISSLQELYNLRIDSLKYKNESNLYRNSASYKLGYFLLHPFQVFFNLIKRIRFFAF
jgi:glycosyltransferase involved in cell wall biosynthesis